MIKIKHVKKALQGGHDQLKKKGGGSSTFYFTLNYPVSTDCSHFANIRKTEVFSKEIERRIFQM